MDYPIKGPWDRQTLSEFLWTAAIPMRLATIDLDGHPVIHPVWFHYQQNKLYATTSPYSKKIVNVTQNPTAYFCIDSQDRPYKGVRGKAVVKVINDIEFSIDISRQMVLKYLGRLDHPATKTVLRNAAKSYVLELTPYYLITWDYSIERP
ncbi:MAG: pyridoxamine 5'-phosphate oxidase family protein [Candidatus Ranarchaeia archaeon]